MAQRDEIERILAKDQSLFTTTSVDFIVDIDITERLEPIIIIQTNEGMKQEVLEEQYTDYIFQDMARGSWEDNGGSEFYCNAWLRGSIEA